MDEVLHPWILCEFLSWRFLRHGRGDFREPRVQIIEGYRGVSLMQLSASSPTEVGSLISRLVGGVNLFSSLLCYRMGG